MGEATKVKGRFKASGGVREAVALVAYASTPIWLAGIFYMFVPLAPFVLVGTLYAIYLFYLGVGPVMKTPADKVIPYMLLSALAIIVVWIILGLLMAAMGFISGGYGGMF